jgi:protein arginine kinase activator
MPVQCQECGNRPATLHFTKIVGGEKTELHICETCARDKGELIPGTQSGFSIHNLLSGLMNFDPAGAGTEMKQPAVRCDTCGMTYNQFSKIGRFGCSECYKHFDERLDPLLKRVHGNTAHVGKVPKRAGGKVRTKREIDELKKEMQDRIEHEDFESAAQLRDRIKNLEKEVSGG